eukprot:symbB.v1.2.002028.t1/scaffold104.1/size473687/6
MKRSSQSRAGAAATEWPEAFQAMMAKTTLKDHLDAAKEDLKTCQRALKKLKEGGFAGSISPETLVLAHHFCAAHLSNDGRLRPWFGLLVQDSSANVQMKTDASTFGGHELVASSKIKA